MYSLVCLSMHRNVLFVYVCRFTTVCVVIIDDIVCSFDHVLLSCIAIMYLIVICVVIMFCDYLCVSANYCLFRSYAFAPDRRHAE